MLNWGINIFSSLMSTRGSADNITALLVFISLYFLKKKKNYFISGFFYGLSVHFKIYPIVISLILYLYISKNKNIINKEAIIFTLTSLITFLIITLFFYKLYGYKYL